MRRSTQWAAHSASSENDSESEDRSCVVDPILDRFA